jgi:hypothetical protein
VSERNALEQLEASDLDVSVALAWLVREQVPIDESDLKAALRRAMLVLAAGGDPHRELDHDEVAVERLAAELDAPGRRRQLAGALEALAAESAGLPVVSEGLATLLDKPDLAWRTYALALLADELADG